MSWRKLAPLALRYSHGMSYLAIVRQAVERSTSEDTMAFNIRPTQKDTDTHTHTHTHLGSHPGQENSRKSLRQVGGVLSRTVYDRQVRDSAFSDLRSPAKPRLRSSEVAWLRQRDAELLEQRRSQFEARAEETPISVISAFLAKLRARR